MADKIWDCIPAYIAGGVGIGGIIATLLAPKASQEVKISVIWTIVIFTALTIAICLVLWVKRVDIDRGMVMKVDYRSWSWFVGILAVAMIIAFVWWQAFFVATKTQE
jgi:hypothetical protein